VLAVLVFAPLLFAFARAGFRHPLLTAIPVSIAVFLVVALVAGSLGVNALVILVIIAIAAIIFGLLAPIASTNQRKRRNGHDVTPVSFHPETRASDIEQKSSKTHGVPIFFVVVGFLLLIGVLLQENSRPTRTRENRFANVGAGGAFQPTPSYEEISAVPTYDDPREQAIIDRNLAESEGDRISKLFAKAQGRMEVDVRRQQRAYAEQAPAEVVAPVRDLLSSRGDRAKVLDMVRKMTPEQRDETLRLAAGVAQQMGDDRGGAAARCFAAVASGVTNRLVNPIMEFFGIGGTAKEIGFIRQLDEMALQEFHHYRLSDPWYERMPLEAIEMLPLAFLIGVLVFFGYRWRARSSTQSSAAPTLPNTHSDSNLSDAELESLRKRNEELKRKVEARKRAEKQAEDKAALEAENARLMEELGEGT
jgi:hypothetical protein